METITIQIFQDDVYEEVAKATDYTGAKLIDGDATARDRILAADEDLATLSRFWEESVMACNERFKEILVRGGTKTMLVPFPDKIPFDKKEAMPQSPGNPIDPSLPVGPALLGEYKIGYEAVIEVSKAFDKNLAESVESTLRSFFIASIIGQWFKFANKGEASDYFTQGAEQIDSAERMLYSRKRPSIPTD